MIIAAGVLSGAWLVAIVAAPYLASHSNQASWVFRSTTGVYMIGSLVCHQRPDRSFHTADIQWPICARCTGLYAGAPLGAALAALWGRRRHGATPVRSCPKQTLRDSPPIEDKGSPGLRRTWPDRCRRRQAGAGLFRLVLGVAAMPTILTLVSEWPGLIRAIAAVPLGAAVAWVVLVVSAGDTTR